MPDPPCLSFIAIVDFTDEAHWLYLSDSVVDLLGYEPRELIGRPAFELVHPDEFPRVKRMHYNTIKADQAAVLVYVRMKHKDPNMGYILCLISRTVVHNILCGSVSFASPAQAMHTASTAQEVRVISPSATKYGFSRWTEPIQMDTPPSNPWSSASQPAAESSSSSTSANAAAGHPPNHGRTSSVELRRENTFSFERLPNQSLRTLFILDRFSAKCPILYCSNDLLVTSTEVVTRSFFDFVYEKDEDTVRTWINQVKSWGVNDLGQPSEGGFGYGWFTMLTKGRDSSASDRMPEPSATSRGGGSRHQRGASSRSKPSATGASSTAASSRTHNPSASRSGKDVVALPSLPSLLSEGPSPLVQVDAIFSAHSDGVMVVLRRSEQT